VLFNITFVVTGSRSVALPYRLSLQQQQQQLVACIVIYRKFTKECLLLLVYCMLIEKKVISCALKTLAAARELHACRLFD